MADAFDGLFVGWGDRTAERVVPRSIEPNLYHYTSATGLIGIVEGDCLWFSDALFLNDGSEVLWGLNLATQTIDQLATDLPPDEKEFAELLKRAVWTHAEAARPIVFCLSDRPNLLNQWRDYGKGIVPYCIELDARGLIDRIQTCNFGQSSPALMKVIYDEAAQRKILSDLILDMASFARTMRDRDLLKTDEAQGKLAISMAVQVVWLVYRFKNPAFEAEREWRLVVDRVRVPDEDMHFRETVLGAVPYFVWRKTDPSSPRLPIKAVMVGPSPSAPTSNLALKMLLGANGHNVPTFYSTIPDPTLNGRPNSDKLASRSKLRFSREPNHPLH